jgi:hypothetical protein
MDPAAVRRHLFSPLMVAMESAMESRNTVGRYEQGLQMSYERCVSYKQRERSDTNKPLKPCSPQDWCDAISFWLRISRIRIADKTIKRLSVVPIILGAENMLYSTWTSTSTTISTFHSARYFGSSCKICAVCNTAETRVLAGFN